MSFENTSTFSKYQSLFFFQKMEDILICPVSYEILNEPRTTSCGHTFSSPSIRQLLAYDKPCPFDKTPLVEETVENLFVRNLVEQKPLKTIFLVSQKHSASEQNQPELVNFNKLVDSKVEELQLDDRKDIKINFLEMMKCPISKKKMQLPVLNACGHTFEINSIREDSKCPFDNEKIEKIKLTHNLLAKEAIDFFENKYCKVADEILVSTLKGRAGVFLFLRPETPLGKIGNIAKSLGILEPEAIKARFCMDGWNASDVDLEFPICKIAKLNSDATEIPVLQLLNAEIPKAKIEKFNGAAREFSIFNSWEDSRVWSRSQLGNQGLVPPPSNPFPLDRSELNRSQLERSQMVQSGAFIQGQSPGAVCFEARIEGLDVGFGNTLGYFSSVNDWKEPFELFSIAPKTWIGTIPYSAFKFIKIDQTGHVTWEKDLSGPGHRDGNRGWCPRSSGRPHSFQKYMEIHPIQFPN